MNLNLGGLIRKLYLTVLKYHLAAAPRWGRMIGYLGPCYRRQLPCCHVILERQANRFHPVVVAASQTKLGADDVISVLHLSIL
jgi:hypothetical protein